MGGGGMGEKRGIRRDLPSLHAPPFVVVNGKANHIAHPVFAILTTLVAIERVGIDLGVGK